MLVVDQVTKMKWSFFLKKKSEQPQVLWDFVTELKNKHKINVRKWRCDNAGENLKTQELFDSKGSMIMFEYTARETPQQNGVVERGIATLWGKVRAMLNGAKVTATYRNGSWCDAVSCATKLDVLLVDKEGEKCPFEKFYGEMPKYAGYLKTFGEIGIVTISNTSKKSKLEDRGKACMFVGYAKNHTGNTYRMINLQTNKIWITRDVIWVHQNFGDYFSLTKKMITIVGDNDNNIVEVKEPVKVETVMEPEIEIIDEVEEIEGGTREGFRLTREMRGLRSYNIPGKMEVAEFCFSSVLMSDTGEPTSFREAWDYPDCEKRAKWQEAIRRELRTMIKRGTWRKISKSQVPSDRTLIGSRWVFKVKNNGVFRARLVGLGYSQIPGVDFSEHFSPVINDVTFRTLLAIMLARGWRAKLIDVETAFLYADLMEEIYMKCPEGMNEFDGTNENNTCILLQKSIY